MPAFILIMAFVSVVPACRPVPATESYLVVTPKPAQVAQSEITGDHNSIAKLPSL